MEFTNTFDVDAPLERVWGFMLNAQEVAPCVPGAAITDTVDDTHYKGTVKVKLGAVQVSYRGELEMQPDEPNRTIVLTAKGTEQRGSGGASGVITNVLTESGSGTHVEIHSKIDVTGKVATFGRGIMQDVANKLIRDFSVCLERKLIAAETAATRDAAAVPSAAGTHRASAPGAAAVSEQSSTATVSAGHSPPSEVAELKMSGILIAILRGRLAAGLRLLASIVEPK
jgi:carbon monoxide dehydrogenase subunit G